jgi:hypothetical protein
MSSLKKGKELLKAARSKALITGEKQIVSGVEKTSPLGMIVEASQMIEENHTGEIESTGNKLINKIGKNNIVIPQEKKTAITDTDLEKELEKKLEDLGRLEENVEKTTSHNNEIHIGMNSGHININHNIQTGNVTSYNSSLHSNTFANYNVNSNFPEVRPKMNDRLAMFENKNKIPEKPLLAKAPDTHYNTPAGVIFNKNSNLNNNNNKNSNVLSRMNKENKEPLKLVALHQNEIKNDQVIDKNNPIIKSAVNDNSKIEVKDESIENPEELTATKSSDQDKLMKRIATAKKNKSTLKASVDKTANNASTKIIGMAAMFQNKLPAPKSHEQEKELNKLLGENVDGPKKSFLLDADEDVQLINENSEKISQKIQEHNDDDLFANKNQVKDLFVDILLEKPTTHYAQRKKTTRKEFTIPKDL